MVLTAKARAALRAIDCDSILPNGRVPLPSNMTPARHIPNFTVITTIIFAIDRPMVHPYTHVLHWIPEGFSLGVERSVHVANLTPPCRAEVKKDCSCTSTSPGMVL
jgi:hypothetical protein